MKIFNKGREQKMREIGKRIKKEIAAKIKDINFVEDYKMSGHLQVDRKFESRSKVDWSPIKMYNTDSSIYRRRFATLFLMNFYNNFDEYIENYKIGTGDEIDYELLSKCLDKFHYETVYGADMCRAFIYLNNVMNYTYNKDKEEQNRINDSLWNYIVGESFDETEFPLIFVLASRLATNSTYKEELPRIEYFDKPINSNFEEAITLLGRNIIGAGKLSEAFVCYCNARPKIKVHKSIDRSSELMLGITALSFLAYIHSDSDLSHVICKILRNVKYTEFDKKVDCCIV